MAYAMHCTMIIKFKDDRYADFVSEGLKANLILEMKLETEYVFCLETHTMRYDKVLIVGFRDSKVDDLPELVKKHGGEVVFRTFAHTQVGTPKSKKERTHEQTDSVLR